MQLELRELVDRAANGDHEAFAAVVRAGSGRLYAIAYRILRDADLADDALQETLVKVWDDLPALRDPDRFDAWAARILCRCCYRLAKRERRASLPIVADPSSARATALEPRVADHDEMEGAFRRLSPEHRAVLVLHYYLGLTLSEIAETLSIRPGTVGSRLHYATRSLRAALEFGGPSHRGVGASSMTRDQDLERHLGDWLADGPVVAPDQVIDDALERTAERRQHHPLRVRLGLLFDARSWNREHSARPLPLATVVIVGVVLLAVSTLTFGPLGGAGSAPPMDPSAVRVIEGSVEVVRHVETEGGAERFLRIESEDPRIRGEAHQVFAIEDAPEADLGRSGGVMRLENEWGAWEGAVNGVRYPDGTEIEYGWLLGDGAYAGYSYFHSTRDHPAEAERVLEGAIWPGEPPPMPDPSLLQADPLAGP